MLLLVPFNDRKTSFSLFFLFFFFFVLAVLSSFDSASDDVDKRQSCISCLVQLIKIQKVFDFDRDYSLLECFADRKKRMRKCSRAHTTRELFLFDSVGLSLDSSVFFPFHPFFRSVWQLGHERQIDFPLLLLRRRRLRLHSSLTATITQIQSLSSFVLRLLLLLLLSSCNWHHHS